MNIAAFVDSLKYMLTGMVSIFVVMAVVWLMIVGIKKATNKSKKEAE